MIGYVKLHRQILNWEWLKTPHMLRVWTYLLLKANFHDSKFEGRDIKRGQLVFGLFEASKDTGISVQSIRTCIERLKSTGEITRESTNKFSIITICNYNLYQPIEEADQQANQQANQQTTNKQSTSNQQHPKKINKGRSKEEEIGPGLHPSPLAPSHLDRKKLELKPYPGPDSKIFLTDKEVQYLITEYGEDALAVLINDFKSWVGSTAGKKKTDHYLTLRNIYRRKLADGYVIHKDTIGGWGFYKRWIVEHETNRN